ncbi:restriction endonuclease subunit S [Streptomyces aurantiogriseus]|uniref:restriction endonuclease subunit S n=1 Tax=Streptomyces aurantiogriseus TaxID=66870 RepID=UPI001675AD35|nr:restriction endonuclease subunit S [Streptomyces aurantiogriseus]
MTLRTDLGFSVWNPDSNVSNYKLVEPNDFVIGLRSFQHGISHSTVRGIVSPAYTVLRAAQGADPCFYKHYFRSGLLVSQLANITQGIRQGQAIDIEAFKNLRVPMPPLEEQRRIADFLDAETARIDAVTDKRNAQMAALDERELAIIGRMLSGEATPTDGQATGWPWLPWVPKSWLIGPVYAYFFTELGKMLDPARTAGQTQRPYLRNANVHWYEIDTSDMATMHFEANEVRRYSVQPGDLLVCEGGAGVAEAAVWDGRIAECYFQKSLHRVRQAGNVPVEWLMLWLRYAKSCGVFDADGNIATIPHLTGEQLRQYRIPIPPDSAAITKDTLRAIDASAALRRRLGEAQKLLAERRQALITAAVTGQFDVSTASGRNVTEGVTE